MFIGKVANPTHWKYIQNNNFLIFSSNFSFQSKSYDNLLGILQKQEVKTKTFVILQMIFIE